MSWLGTETCYDLHVALEPSDPQNIHTPKLSTHGRMVGCSSLMQTGPNSSIGNSWAVQVRVTEKTFRLLESWVLTQFL